MNNTFSKKLTRLRKERKFTQENLAEALGVSFQAVSKWETAQSYPDIELLPPLARFLTTSRKISYNLSQDFLQQILIHYSDIPR